MVKTPIDSDPFYIAASESSESIDDIWDDDPFSVPRSFSLDDALEERDRRIAIGLDDFDTHVPKGRLERVKDFVGRRKREIAAVIMLSGVAAGGVTMLEKSTAEDTSDITPVEQVVEGDAEEVAEAIETVGPYDHLLLDAEELPEVKDEPFVDENKAAEDALRSALGGGSRLSSESLLDEHKLFAGAYESISGVKFNIYTSDINGDSQNYNVNPQALEFIISYLKEELPHGPKNEDTRQIIENLNQIESGEEERIFNIQLDVSSDPTCLNGEMQIVRAINGICVAEGVTEVFSDVGMRDRETLDIKATDYPDVEYVDNYETNMREPVRVKTNGSGDIIVVAHEVGVHGLADYHDNDFSMMHAYEEGDDMHEASAHLGIGGEPEKFDMAGAEKPPIIDFSQYVHDLIEAGKLSPIVTPA